MYRVYDTVERCWVKDEIYLSPNDDLSTSKNALFGTKRMSLISSDRYVFQNDIGLNDENENLIFEGDICKNERLDMIGIIAYCQERASYLLFDYNKSKYYTLGINECKELTIIGNNFENDDLFPF